MFSVLNISVNTILFYIDALLQQYVILKIVSLSGNRFYLPNQDKGHLIVCGNKYEQILSKVQN